jgi:protein gp37
MADRSNIEWTDATWNALRGCSRVSEGCRNCYAEGMAGRFSDPGQWGHGIATREPESAERYILRGRWTGQVVLDEKALLKPRHWKKPRRIFVTSIGDPFHHQVTDDMLDRLFSVMAMCPQHTFQLLTKRPERMQEYLKGIERRAYENDCHPTDFLLTHCIDDAWWKGMGRRVPPKHPWPLPNVWIGTSVENQATADQRIPQLLATPAAVRFLSCEPLLGPVSIESHLMSCDGCGNQGSTALTLNRPGSGHDLCRACTKGEEGAPSIDWVIVGGESGPKARPVHPDWVRSLRDQCAAASVPFLFKQWGEWWADKELDCCGGPGYSDACVARQHRWDDGCTTSLRVGKKIAGRLLDCVEHNAFPEVRHV